MPSANSENRLKNFKNKGKDNDELRRRRNEVSVELRKNKKDDMLSKRRNVGPGDDEPLSPLQENKQPTPQLSIEEIQNGIQSTDPHRQLQATQSARKILSRERNPPIDVMINLGILPRLVEFLGHADAPALQFEVSYFISWNKFNFVFSGRLGPDQHRLRDPRPDQGRGEQRGCPTFCEATQKS